MIALDQVSISVPGKQAGRAILRDVTCQFPQTARVGILSASGTGKSTIARLLGGIEQPESGRILRQGRVSWPIGFAGFLHPDITVRDNIRHLARLIGEDPQAMTARCEAFFPLPGAGLSLTKDISPGERAILSYACSMVNYYDHYIADETISVGGAELREKCNALLAERLEQAGLVFLSRNTRQLKEWCNVFYLHIAGNLVPVDDLDVAEVALHTWQTQQGATDLPAYGEA